MDFAEGEDERVLRTVQSLREEAGMIPVLVGRPEVLRDKIMPLVTKLQK